MCRGGYFLLPNREKPSPRSLIGIKRSAVQRGKRVSKKNGEMSYNFGEIIKNYIRCLKKPSQAAIQGFPPPPTSSQVAMADFPCGGEKCASCRPRLFSSKLSKAVKSWRNIYVQTFWLVNPPSHSLLFFQVFYN